MTSNADDRCGAHPRRVQLRRVKGWRLPPNTVKVDRSTKWGNPFVPGKTYPIIEEGCTTPMGQHKCASVADAVAMYESWVTSEQGFDQEEIEELTGKNLACWCKPGSPCHADVLLKIANEDQP